MHFLKTSFAFHGDRTTRERPGSGPAAAARVRIRRRAAHAGLILGLTAAGACYSFSGGGGFPNDIRTIYIAPFENTTPQFDLEQQVFTELQEELPRALGIRPGSEQTADAIVRGRIIRYDDRAQSNPISQPGPVVHVVEIAVAVEIIDVKRNVVLWESSALTAQGEYRPESQDENVGRRIALDQLSQRILDGAQQQW